MSIITVQNRQKRTWTVPGIMGKNNSFLARPVAVEPGEKAMIQSEHWNQVKKGNRVIEALLTSRALVVTAAGKDQPVAPEALANPASPAAPADLKEKDERVKVETKTELKQIDLSAAPAEGKGVTR